MLGCDATPFAWQHTNTLSNVPSGLCCHRSAKRDLCPLVTEGCLQIRDADVKEAVHWDTLLGSEQVCDACAKEDAHTDTPLGF